MDSVLRAAAVYAFLFLVFRASGKRTLAQITTFDFVLLLIVGEATQQGLLGNDFSVTNAFLVVLTLIGLDVGVSVLKLRLPATGKYLESLPLVIVENGKPLKERMDRARVDVDDVMEYARKLQGLESLEQVKYAVLERDGSVSVIPTLVVKQAGGSRTAA